MPRPSASHSVRALVFVGVHTPASGSNHDEGLGFASHIKYLKFSKWLVLVARSEMAMFGIPPTRGPIPGKQMSMKRGGRLCSPCVTVRVKTTGDDFLEGKGAEDPNSWYQQFVLKIQKGERGETKGEMTKKNISKTDKLCGNRSEGYSGGYWETRGEHRAGL